MRSHSEDTGGDASETSGLNTLAEAAGAGASGEDQLDDEDAESEVGENLGLDNTGSTPVIGSGSGDVLAVNEVVAVAGVTLQAHLNQNQA